MFESLSSQLDDVFRRLRGRGTISEGNIKDAMGEVRRALLQADVNFRVAKNFVKTVEEKAIGQSVVRSISPGQQVVKIVHDELVELMEEARRNSTSMAIRRSSCSSVCRGPVRRRRQRSSRVS